MKTIVKPLAAALVAATSLAGAAVATALPAAAETVLRLDESAVGEIDPGKATDYADSILMFNLYDTLVVPAQGGPGYAPHLAESWEAEGSDFVFRLRPGVTFLSGNPLTAEDVVFSFDRMKALGQGLSFLFEKVESAVAVDDNTVRFSLSETYAPFIASLVRLPIVDKKTVLENLGEGEGEFKDWGQAYLSGVSAGSGAYSIVSHNPQEETVLRKNPGYFLGVPDAAPDTVRLRYSLEAATVRTLIAQGEHDIASQWLPPEVSKALADGGAQFLKEAGGGAFYIKLNTAKAPLDDVNCRLALAKAYDYEAGMKMVAITDDVVQGSPATGAIPVGMYGANPADQTLKRDLDAARQHLADCQYDPADFTLEISWIGEVPIEERFALLMQANFAEIGIRSEIRKVPWALYSEQVTNPETTPNISQVYVNTVTGDPDTLFYSMYHSTAPRTWQSPENLNDAAVDAAIEKGRTSTDPAEREAAYKELNARLMEISPSIYAYDLQSVFAASPRVKAPALSGDPDQAFSLAGAGFTFRLMEVAD